MRLGVEASNLRLGGGITHLREILRAADPREFGISEIVVWGGAATIADLPTDREWLRLVTLPRLDSSASRRLMWQTLFLTRRVRRACDLLFAPGGSYAGSFRPFVTMSRNMLPFDQRERRRYGVSKMRMKLGLLNRLQTATMRRADGVIFLNDFAREQVGGQIGAIRGQVATIPHGVDDSFRFEPRTQLPISAYDTTKPFRLLYVSTIDLYKHQWNVIEAVARLRQQGLPVNIEFQGPAYTPAMRCFDKARQRFDPQSEFVIYRGVVKYPDVRDSYKAADAFVFASSCENMPNILLEAMAAGLPIASSSRASMPEILGDAGCYFDPEDIDSLTAALGILVKDHDQRERWAKAAFERAKAFSWNRCAEQTFAFLRAVADSRPAVR